MAKVQLSSEEVSKWVSLLEEARSCLNSYDVENNLEDAPMGHNYYITQLDEWVNTLSGLSSANESELNNWSKSIYELSKGVTDKGEAFTAKVRMEEVSERMNVLA